MSSDWHRCFHIESEILARILGLVERVWLFRTSLFKHRDGRRGDLVSVLPVAQVVGIVQISGKDLFVLAATVVNRVLIGDQTLL